MKKLEPVIVNNKIKIAITSNYGAGWSTWNSSNKELSKLLLFDKSIIELVENNKIDILSNEEEMQKLLETSEHIYTGGAIDLEIEEVDISDTIFIYEYDGAEQLIIISENSDMCFNLKNILGDKINE